MSKPKILHAIHELDENGFYDKSTYLGDIRTSPTCLDSTFENGIYAFTGGETSPTDATGSHKWVLVVYACEDCTSVLHEAKRLNCQNSELRFSRYYNNSAWGPFIDTTATPISLPLSADDVTYNGAPISVKVDELDSNMSQFIGDIGGMNTMINIKTESIENWILTEGYFGSAYISTGG